MCLLDMRIHFFNDIDGVAIGTSSESIRYFQGSVLSGNVQEMDHVSLIGLDKLYQTMCIRMMIKHVLDETDFVGYISRVDDACQ